MAVDENDSDRVKLAAICDASVRRRVRTEVSLSRKGFEYR
jgi:hypothetical protein